MLLTIDYIDDEIALINNFKGLKTELALYK